MADLRHSKPRLDPVDTPFDVGNQWNISRTMANSLEAFTGFVRFSNQLRKASLSPRLREVVILRVGALLGSDYEWGRHVLRARDAGLEDREIRAIRSGDLEQLPELDRLVARFAEAVERRNVTDQMWGEMESRFTKSDLTEITTFASYYGFVSRFLLATNVQLDDDIEGLDYP